MISGSTLEEIEDKTGYIYGIDTQSGFMCLGISSVPVSPQTGLISCSTPKNNNYKTKLTTSKKEISKNNNTKFYKQYTFEVDNKQIKQVFEKDVSKLLSQYAVVQLTGVSELSETIFGYQYKGQTFKIGQEKLLFEKIKQQHSKNTNSLNEMVSQTEQIIKPFKHVIKIIASMKTPTQNKFQQTTTRLSNKMIRFIGNITTNGLFELFNQNLKTLMEKQQQPIPSFLDNILQQIPKKIWSPHIYLPSPHLFMHQRFMIKGHYEFYHYGDQTFNDNGWGCAYRAFQSVLSWFNLGGHSSIPIPTIQQIQRKLFQIDKSRNLINTNQWIGANEVGWLINKYLNIDSKIVFLQDGENIMDKVDVFKHHFQTIGTPIMYGGGQYAYTILGINYSWKLGQCQFLILDPHYTLDDKPKTIIEKQGVSWKDKSKLFKKGVYYNFCLPQLRLTHEVNVGGPSLPNKQKSQEGDS